MRLVQVTEMSVRLVQVAEIQGKGGCNPTLV